MPYKKLLPHIIPATESLQIIGGGGEKALSGEFNLLVWNIYKAKKRAWEKDFKALAEGKDLVMLQEAIFRSRFDALFDIPERMEWVMAKSHISRTVACETGIKTGCVVPSASQAFFVSPDAEPIFKTPKMLLATLYPIKDHSDALLAINIHAINFVSFTKYSRQMTQVAEAIEHHAGPVILAGDFNTWNARRHNELRTLVQRLNLTELPLTRKARFSHMYQHLDHVFYRGLESVSAEFKYVKSSDHDPISARFRLSM